MESPTTGTPASPPADPMPPGASVDDPGRRRERRLHLPRPRSRRWAAAAALGAALLLGGCQLPTFGAFKGATTQGQDALKLWQLFFIAGAAMFALVFCLIIWSALRYRRRSDAIPPQTQYHTIIEIIYTTVPILLVFVLFAFTFVTENEVDAVTKKQVTVNVTAFQWGWQFQYPTYDVKVVGIETEDPTMVLPVGKTVRIYLRSADVIHGFYVPAFNFSRYALPGHTNQFNLHILHTGDYRGQCNQFCGLYHSLMFFQVKAVTSAQFTTWIHHEQNGTASNVSISQAKQQALGGPPG